MIKADTSSFPHESATIIVAGMHRSGTSLTASILQSSGVNIGERLVGKEIGNEKGHFEDLDMVDFHKEVLLSQGIEINGLKPGRKISFGVGKTPEQRCFLTSGILCFRMLIL